MSRRLLDAHSDLKMPNFSCPINLGLASTVPVPGVVIDGASMRLALARTSSTSGVNYIAGTRKFGIRSGASRPMIVATFEDKEGGSSCPNV